MALFADRLSPLQQAVLAGLARAEPRLFLSGGAALVGFHLGHRVTLDLDFFARSADVLPAALQALRDVATGLHATLTVRQQTPSFVRAVVERPGEALVVDLVHEPMPQVHEEKLAIDGVRVDPLDEILANKLTALVGRQEERDLVDVWFIERAGLRVEDLLDAAARKDGGCTPATLAWLLNTFPLPPAERLPDDCRLEDLSTWRDRLVERLLRRAQDDVRRTS